MDSEDQIQEQAELDFEYGKENLNSYVDRVLEEFLGLVKNGRIRKNSREKVLFGVTNLKRLRSKDEDIAGELDKAVKILLYGLNEAAREISQQNEKRMDRQLEGFRDRRKSYRRSYIEALPYAAELWRCNGKLRIGQVIVLVQEHLVSKQMAKPCAKTLSEWLKTIPKPKTATKVGRPRNKSA